MVHLSTPFIFFNVFSCWGKSQKHIFGALSGDILTFNSSPRGLAVARAHACTPRKTGQLGITGIHEQASGDSFSFWDVLPPLDLPPVCQSRRGNLNITLCRQEGGCTSLTGISGIHLLSDKLFFFLFWPPATLSLPVEWKGYTELMPFLRHGLHENKYDLR